MTCCEICCKDLPTRSDDRILQSDAPKYLVKVNFIFVFAMESAAQVLKNLTLVEVACQFQNGLPIELMEITHLAETIVIIPCYTLTSGCPTAYLTNIPSRFIDTPYLQPLKHWNRLPNYALFLYDHYKEPTLPLHLSIVENNIKHVDMWIKHKPEWLTPAPLKLAAICGHLEIVKRLVNASKAVWTPEAMDLAAMNGHLDVVKYLHGIENGPGCTTQAMDGAASFGHLEVVVFLNENRSEGCTRKALQGAVNKGYAKVVEYLLNHRHEQYTPIIFFIYEYYRIQSHRAVEEKDYIGVIQCLHNQPFASIDENLIMTAIKHNPLSTVKLLHKENIYGITKKVLDTLIESRDKNAIRYALEIILTDNDKPISLFDHDNNDVDPWTPLDNPELLSRSTWGDRRWGVCKAMDIAAALGDLDIVILLHRTRIKCCTVDAMNKAAAIGRLDIVQWLHTHRTEGCTDDAMTYAIAGGHFEMVQWLRRVCGLNCTKEGLSTAAYNGDVDMVKYLISIRDSWFGFGGNVTIGSPYGPSIKVFHGYAVDQAARNGHIKIVEILKDCPATTDAMNGAACKGHFEMVKYLHTHRTEGCTADAYRHAARTNRFDILEYLVTNKCCRGDVNFEQLCIDASGCNHIEILAYFMNLLKDNFSPKLRQLMMFQAAMRGQLDVVKWLHEVKGFGSTSLIQEQAERRGHKRIVQYLNSIGNCEDNILDAKRLWY